MICCQSSDPIWPPARLSLSLPKPHMRKSYDYVVKCKMFSTPKPFHPIKEDSRWTKTDARWTNHKAAFCFLHLSQKKRRMLWSYKTREAFSAFLASFRAFFSLLRSSKMLLMKSIAWLVIPMTKSDSPESWIWHLKIITLESWGKRI